MEPSLYLRTSTAICGISFRQIRSVPTGIQSLTLSHQVQRALYRTTTALNHVRVNHCGIYMAVAQQLLDSTYVIPTFQKVGGEGMSKCMATCLLADASGAHTNFDRPIQTGRMNVVPPFFLVKSNKPYRLAGNRYCHFHSCAACLYFLSMAYGMDTPLRLYRRSCS